MTIPECEAFFYFQVEASASEQLEFPGSVTPEDYLGFGTDDISENVGVRSWVNAVANAKRALHFQVDVISNALGYENLPRKERRGFPSRLLRNYPFQ